MKRFILIIAGILILAGADHLNAVQGIQVELQFYKQTYRLNEPVPVMINVINTSDTALSFYVSSLIYETFFFTLLNPKSEEMPLLDRFQVEIKNNASSSGDWREIKLLPGESFSRVIDITEWFDIKESGYYYIKGRFFANPDKKSDLNESFNYKILVKPPLLIENKLNDEEQERITVLENIQKLPPYDAVEDLLDAKMKKDWDRFLAHIDAERLIQSFQSYNQAFENARSGRYRLEVLDDFKKYLTVHWQDRILSYKILESQIKDDNATVLCDVDYKVRLYSYTLRYTFNLYKNHVNQWLIYDYSAVKVQ
jgi:hypothetical protein